TCGQACYLPAPFHAAVPRRSPVVLDSAGSRTKAPRPTKYRGNQAMDRSAVRLCSLPLGFFFAALATGCSIVPTIAYIIKPEDVAAEFDELNGKRLAVVCCAAGVWSAAR